MSLLRAWCTLVLFQFRRLVWSSGTLMLAFPIVLTGLFTLRRQYGAMASVGLGFQRFSEELLIGLFTAFVLPVCALAYGTSSIGRDREDRTLLFLLVRPIPRPLVFLGAFAAALPLVLGLTVGSFYVYCRMSGEPGRLAFGLYLPAVFCMSLAYTTLFHLLAVLFRHATMLALVYALFMELLLGTMPGVIKRLAVNYYGRSMIFDLGAAHGLPAPDPRWFEPLGAADAAGLLWTLSAAALIAGLVVFQWREYRDLT